MDFFNEINLLYGTVCDFCSDESCPIMCAGETLKQKKKLKKNFVLLFCVLVVEKLTLVFGETGLSHQHTGFKAKRQIKKTFGFSSDWKIK